MYEHDTQCVTSIWKSTEKKDAKLEHSPTSDPTLL